MRLCQKNQKGIAMTIVMVVLMVLAIMAGYVMNLGFNRKRIVDVASGTRTVIYYRAQAGVHHATARIRKNYTAGLVPAGSFLDPNYNPGPYTIDVDGNGRMDTSIDIGPANVQGQRIIEATGLDTEV